jgi:hypothetical protein
MLAVIAGLYSVALKVLLMLFLVFRRVKIPQGSPASREGRQKGNPVSN